MNADIKSIFMCKNAILFILTVLCGYSGPCGAEGSKSKIKGTVFTDKLVCPEDFGAYGDRVHDDTIAVQKAIDSLGKAGGTVYLKTRYLIDTSDIIVKRNVSLIGREGIVGNCGQGNKATNDDYISKGCQIVLSPNRKVILKGSASVKGLMFWRKGMVIPTDGVTGFKGTCIKVEGEDCYAGYCLILGFNQALVSKGHQRVRVEFVQGDCTNGIWIADSWDVSTVKNCHFWPFTSTASRKNLERSGVAYRFSGVNDIAKIIDCFEFGYKIGYKIEQSCGMSLINCVADGVARLSNPPYTTPGSIGFDITGYGRGIRLIGCEAWSKELAYNIQPEDTVNTGEKMLPVSLIGCKAEQVNNGIKSKCDLMMNSCDIRGIKLGERFGVGCEVLGDSFALINGCRFKGFDTAIKSLEKRVEVYASRILDCNEKVREND